MAQRAIYLPRGTSPTIARSQAHALSIAALHERLRTGQRTFIITLFAVSLMNSFPCSAQQTGKQVGAAVGTVLRRRVQPTSEQPAEIPGVRVETSVQTSLRTGPEGSAVLMLPAGTLLTPLFVESGWTRVRVEGWVPSRELVDAKVRGAGTVTAAELRADPQGNRGKIVHWSVEALAFQTGDALRHELNGQPYLLARGPGKERAILYLALPDSLVGAARALPALTSISITARVRNGRSEPAGIPILELTELFRR